MSLSKIKRATSGFGLFSSLGPFFSQKMFSCFDGETNNAGIFYPQNKNCQNNTFIKKKGGGGEITCIKSVLAHLTKVIPSISKMQSSPLLCHVPAARYSAPLETTVLYLSSECTDCEGTDLKKKRHLSQ